MEENIIVPGIRKTELKTPINSHDAYISQKGHDFKKKLADKIFGLLPQSVIYLNFYLNEEKREEIDILVVDRSGIYIIEAKSYNGWIFGGTRQAKWTVSYRTGYDQSKKFQFNNPINQNELHVNLFKEKFFINSKYLKPIVIFSDTAEFKKLEITDNYPICNECGITKYIKSVNPEISEDIMPEEEFNKLINIFDKHYESLSPKEDNTIKAEAKHITYSANYNTVYNNPTNTHKKKNSIAKWGWIIAVFLFIILCFVFYNIGGEFESAKNDGFESLLDTTNNQNLPVDLNYGFNPNITPFENGYYEVEDSVPSEYYYTFKSGNFYTQSDNNVDWNNYHNINVDVQLVEYLRGAEAKTWCDRNLEDIPLPIKLSHNAGDDFVVAKFALRLNQSSTVEVVDKDFISTLVSYAFDISVGTTYKGNYYTDTNGKTYYPILANNQNIKKDFTSVTKEPNYFYGIVKVPTGCEDICIQVGMFYEFKSFELN